MYHVSLFFPILSYAQLYYLSSVLFFPHISVNDSFSQTTVKVYISFLFHYQFFILTHTAPSPTRIFPTFLIHFYLSSRLLHTYAFLILTILSHVYIVTYYLYCLCLLPFPFIFLQPLLSSPIALTISNIST